VEKNKLGVLSAPIQSSSAAERKLRLRATGPATPCESPISAWRVPLTKPLRDFYEVGIRQALSGLLLSSPFAEEHGVGILGAELS